MSNLVSLSTSRTLIPSGPMTIIGSYAQLAEIKHIAQALLAADSQLNATQAACTTHLKERDQNMFPLNTEDLGAYAEANPAEISLSLVFRLQLADGIPTNLTLREIVQRSTNLLSLELNSSAVTDQDFEGLRISPTVTHLMMTTPGITNNCFGHLSHSFPSLESIKLLGNNNISLNRMNHLVGPLPLLKEVYFSRLTNSNAPSGMMSPFILASLRKRRRE